MHVMFQKFAPGIRSLGALRPKAGERPIHISEQVLGLHGGDNSQSVEARELLRRGYLRVLDAKTVIGFGRATRGMLAQVAFSSFKRVQRPFYRASAAGVK